MYAGARGGGRLTLHCVALSTAAVLLGVTCTQLPATATPPALSAADPPVAAAVSFLQTLIDGNLEQALAHAAADQRGDTARTKLQITSLQLNGCQGSQTQPIGRAGEDSTEVWVTVRFVPACGYRSVIRASNVNDPLTACRLGLRMDNGTWQALPLAIQCPAE